MANRRLTPRLIETFKPGKSVREIRDTELRGFGVPILPSGRSSYFVHAQKDGHRVWTKIGDAGAMPLADARGLARTHPAAGRTGDPSRPAETAADTPERRGHHAPQARQHGLHAMSLARRMFRALSCTRILTNLADQMLIVTGFMPSGGGQCWISEFCKASRTRSKRCWEGTIQDSLGYLTAPNSRFSRDRFGN